RGPHGSEYEMTVGCPHMKGYKEAMDFRRPSARRVELLDAPAGGAPREPSHEPELFDSWRTDVQLGVSATIRKFAESSCVADLGATGVDIAYDVLAQFIDGGKYLRSTFAYLGWLCAAPANDAALRAAASFELLHVFALLQDDVMDDSALRRGRPAAHMQFRDWHADRGLSGSSQRFGESAAVLLADLCLVWAEQMFRQSGLPQAALLRAMSRYDAMRTELAVGQFADLVNDARGLPSLDAVLDVARRKSGNYTVRRPLEIGAALAGCDEHTLVQLSSYGSAVGEAFQLRDDLLGVFGSAAVTGKPSGGDLSEHKATSVVVAAHRMADATVRAELTTLMSCDDIDDAAIARWRTLIVTTGAVDWIEDLIAERVATAHQHAFQAQVDGSVRSALVNMALVCTMRTS
ncbi:MAG: geranylgeranyl diphosphate synthase, type, partial [Mycobacterium sp.]|nr:geranylgeranyl diphosphate synthase, type [Mycobacterium sp.]